MHGILEELSNWIERFTDALSITCFEKIVKENKFLKKAIKRLWMVEKGSDLWLKKGDFLKKCQK